MCIYIEFSKRDISTHVYPCIKNLTPYIYTYMSSLIIDIERYMWILYIHICISQRTNCIYIYKSVKIKIHCFLHLHSMEAGFHMFWSSLYPWERNYEEYNAHFWLKILRLLTIYLSSGASFLNTLLYLWTRFVCISLWRLSVWEMKHNSKVHEHKAQQLRKGEFLLCFSYITLPTHTHALTSWPPVFSLGSWLSWLQLG